MEQGHSWKRWLKNEACLKCLRTQMYQTAGHYVMPDLAKEFLCSQDTIHLLAKLKLCLIAPSSLMWLGSETACRGHLVELIKKLPKSQHGLSDRTIDPRDKQNYSSIELLLHQCVDKSLAELHTSVKANGTRIYLHMMNDIRDSLLNRSIRPLDRLYKIWKTVFFLRIWRRWLKNKIVLKIPTS